MKLIKNSITKTLEHHGVDERYQIRKEGSLSGKAQFVIRFCGDWVGPANTKEEAVLEAMGHECARIYALRFGHV